MDPYRIQLIVRGLIKPASTADPYVQNVDEWEAHRQMGFVVRENGRYGSHPLHDRFDDESDHDSFVDQPRKANQVERGIKGIEWQ
jgi:hypothetical protein